LFPDDFLPRESTDAVTSQRRDKEGLWKGFAVELGELERFGQGSQAELDDATLVIVRRPAS
jgi:hypothetical protein